MHCLAFLILIPLLTNGLPNVANGIWDSPVKLRFPIIYSHANAKFCDGKLAGFHSLGRCKTYYAICNYHQELAIVQCPDGHIYRQEMGGCVQETEETWCLNTIFTDHICQDPEKELMALTGCSQEYGICFANTLFTAECQHENEAFSDEYGACVPMQENPGCLPQVHDQIMTFRSTASMCNPGSQHKVFFGPCNQKYMHCDLDGSALMAQCPKDQVAVDGQSEDCVPSLESHMCPQDGDDARFVSQMNTILNSISYCQAKENGLYLEEGIVCQRGVIFCFKNQPSFHLCPPGHDLDRNGWCKKNEACLGQDSTTWRSNYLAIFGRDARLCQGIQTDHLQVHGQCPTFHTQCHFDRFQIENCVREYEIFDVHLQQCRMPHKDEDCPMPNRCLNPELLVAVGPCENEFLTCVNGEDIRFPCETEGSMFNEEMQECVPKDQHPHCPKESNPKEPMVEPPESPVDLTCNGDGGFHVHMDCTKYYRCAHGRLVEMDCAPGTAWDPSITGCNHKHMVARCG